MDCTYAYILCSFSLDMTSNGFFDLPNLPNLLNLSSSIQSSESPETPPLSPPYTSHKLNSSFLFLIFIFILLIIFNTPTVLTYPKLPPQLLHLLPPKLSLSFSLSTAFFALFTSSTQ